jgi:hypothetical protein
MVATAPFTGSWVTSALGRPFLGVDEKEKRQSTKISNCFLSPLSKWNAYNLCDFYTNSRSVMVKELE